MNKYIVPISDAAENYIESVSARSISEAEDKFMDIICEDYEREPEDNWTDFVAKAWTEGITIGEIKDIEEF